MTTENKPMCDAEFLLHVPLRFVIQLLLPDISAPPPPTLKLGSVRLDKIKIEWADIYEMTKAKTL